MAARIQMRDIIARNAEAIRQLQAQVHSTARRRSESPEALAEWKQACATFHASYDALAFPSGLSAALQRLAAADMTTAEEAIAYLEIHPYFFRSQYNATRFTRALKKLQWQLRPDLQRRFDLVRAAAEKRRKVRMKPSSRAVAGFKSADR